MHRSYCWWLISRRDSAAADKLLNPIVQPPHALSLYSGLPLSLSMCNPWDGGQETWWNAQIMARRGRAGGIVNSSRHKRGDTKTWTSSFCFQLLAASSYSGKTKIRAKADRISVITGEKRNWHHRPADTSVRQPRVGRWQISPGDLTGERDRECQMWQESRRAKAGGWEGRNKKHFKIQSICSSRESIHRLLSVHTQLSPGRNNDRTPSSVLGKSFYFAVSPSAIWRWLLACFFHHVTLFAWSGCKLLGAGRPTLSFCSWTTSGNSRGPFCLHETPQALWWLSQCICWFECSGSL